jgi:SAM-dependent methyltransferase
MTDNAPAADHPDRLRWNREYAGRTASFTTHPLAERALALPLPPGPVLDLACGRSGSALTAAACGRHVTAVDISDVALEALGAEARRRGLADLVTLVQADLGTWHPAPSSYALTICTGFWDRSLFPYAAAAVLPGGGALAWQAFTLGIRDRRPDIPAEWCLRPGEPAVLLPDDFTVLATEEAAERRGLLATRR